MSSSSSSSSSSGSVSELIKLLYSAHLSSRESERALIIQAGEAFSGEGGDNSSIYGKDYLQESTKKLPMTETTYSSIKASSINRIGDGWYLMQRIFKGRCILGLLIISGTFSRGNEEDTSDKRLIVEMRTRMEQHLEKYNEPGNILLMTGDIDFLGVIREAKRLGFYVLLAYNEKKNVRSELK
ncbi:hypothetical protein DY000_02042077 [Brassica cretica]|uniref:NYN domain-containing protein n=1 Tax=Brassica cretica TaxID=69181 RepID=A0ABQ7BDE8_BRACR|nr:hypothetical protein DY000_02042077 [Brassica cretica]